MKINLQTRINWCKIMKITFSQLLIALTITGISYAGTMDAQTVLDRPVDLSVNNASLEKVLKKLEKSADTKFIYSTTLIDASQKVSFTVRGEALKAVLDELLKPKKISYRLINNCIVLSYDKIEPLDLKKLPIADIPFAGMAAEESPQHVVRGKVTDAEGTLLVGVTVQVKGKTNGTVTDAGGSYFINVPQSSDTLSFSYLGYTPLNIPVNGRSTIDVQLESSAQSLNDVVVIGYGTQKREDLTGSIGSIRSENIVRSNPVSPYQALQGQVAGVNIAKTSSLAGTDYSIDIRGLGSINYNNAPLIVIDGIMGGDLKSLNPSDIASMDILKDASATAIYGSRGANGVVIITTKKGVEGKAKVTYDAYAGVKVPAHLPEMMTAQQWYKANTEDRTLSGGTAVTFTTDEMDVINSGKSTNWVDEVTSPALQTSHVLAVSGGTTNLTYYFSGGYLNEDGNTIGQNYKRYNIKGSIDAKFNDFVKAGFNTYYTYSLQNVGSFEVLRSAYRSRPTGKARYADLTNPSESSDIDYNGYAVWMGINDHQVLNPLVEGDPDNYQNETAISSLLANAYVELTPIKGLSIKSSLSTAVLGSRVGDFRGTYTKSNAAAAKPTAAYNTNNNTSYTLDNILTYHLKTGPHNFTFTGLQSAFKERMENSAISVKDLPYNSGWYNLNTAGTIVSVGSGLTQRTLLSYMGRFNYGFNDKYMLTLTGRWDGASVLATGHKWGFFPSVGFSWRIINESFMQQSSLFSNLKLRLTYGMVGNDVVPPYGTQANLINTQYDFGGTDAFGFSPAGIANRELGWEKSKEADIGLNLGFLNNRITADIDVYQRNTVDLILKEQLPASTGFSSVTTNLGKVRNSGLEVTLNSVNIQNKHFSWRTNISFSTNKNEIVQLYGGEITKDIGNKLFVGESLRANYDYKFAGIWQTDELELAKQYGQTPGSVKVVDQNNDKKIDANNDRVILGSQLPKWMAGITNIFSYKEWDLSFMIYTRQGVQYSNAMESGTMGQVEKGRYNFLALNYWTPDNPTNDYYGLVAKQPYNSAIFYQDATYWRISDITLGYRLPQKLVNRWKMSNFRLYGQVTNPFVFTKFISFDPEYNSATYIDDVPSVAYRLGLSLSF
ncbi:TonB-dependent receptor [Chitinophaga sp. MM2321]|uniref:TonB-dependent receptor n=1 Tax=Chitinophaga sp. MM2321 TaxID=3137178 RepID=UPI0032D5AC0B